MSVHTFPLPRRVLSLPAQSLGLCIEQNNEGLVWGGGDRPDCLTLERAEERGRDVETEAEEQQRPAPVSLTGGGGGAGGGDRTPEVSRLRGQARGHRELSSQELTQVASLLPLAGGVSSQRSRFCDQKEREPNSCAEGHRTCFGFLREASNTRPEQPGEGTSEDTRRVNLSENWPV